MSNYPRGDCKRASEGDHNHAFAFPTWVTNVTALRICNHDGSGTIIV